MSHKSLLLELCQKNKWRLPEYRGKEKGPDHIPRFTARVHVNGTDYQGSQSSTINAVEHDAARKALEELLNSPVAAATCEKPITLNVGAASCEKPLTLNVAAATCEKPLTLNAAATSPVSQKSLLQELCQQHKLRLPRYDWEKAGPDHDPLFGASVFVVGFTFYSPFWCTSRKRTEDQAARQAFKHFNEHPESIRGATV